MIKKIIAIVLTFILLGTTTLVAFANEHGQPTEIITDELPFSELSIAF